MTDDIALNRILAVIVAIGEVSPIRAIYVCAFLLDCFQSMGDVGARFGKGRHNALKHLRRAAMEFPEIDSLMRSEIRRTTVRKLGQKRKVKM